MRAHSIAACSLACGVLRRALCGLLRPPRSPPPFPSAAPSGAADDDGARAENPPPSSHATAAAECDSAAHNRAKRTLNKPIPDAIDSTCAMSQEASAQHAGDAQSAADHGAVTAAAAAPAAPSAIPVDEDAGQWQTVPVKSKHAMDRASSLTVPEAHSKSARESRRSSQNANAAQAAQIKAAGGRRNSQPQVNGTGQQGASSASTPPTPGSRRLSASGLAAEDFASFRKGHNRGSHVAKATEWRRGSLDPTDAADAAAAATASGPLSPPPLHPHLPRVGSKGKMNQQHTPVKGGDAKRTPKSRGSRSPAVLSPSPQNVGGKDAASKDGRSSPLPSVQHSVGHSRFSLGPTDFPNLSFRRVMWAAERKGGKATTGTTAAAPATNGPESSGEATPAEREVNGGSGAGVPALSGSSSQPLPAAPQAIKPLPVVVTAPPRSFLAAASAGFGPRSSSSGSSPGGSAVVAASPVSPASASASTSVTRAAARPAPTPAVASFVPIIPLPDDDELTAVAPISASSSGAAPAPAATAGTEVAAPADASTAPVDESPPTVSAAAPASVPAPAAKQLKKKLKSPRVAVSSEAGATVAASAAPVVDAAPVVAAVAPAPAVAAEVAVPAPAAPIASPKSARAGASPKASSASAASRPTATDAAPKSASTPKSSSGPKPLEVPVATEAEEQEEEEEEEKEQEAAVEESPRTATQQAAEQATRRSSMLPAPLATALASMPPAQLALFALLGLMLLVAALLPPRSRALLLLCVGLLCVLLCGFHRIRALRNTVPQPWRARLEEAVGIRTQATPTKGATHSRDKQQKKKSKKR